MAKRPYPKNAWHLIRRWPRRLPLLFLGGSGRYSILPLAFSEISKAEAMTATFRPGMTGSETVPFQRGIVGLLSYDDFSGEGSDAAPSRFFRVEAAAVLDGVERQLIDNFREKQEGVHWSLDEAEWEYLLGDSAADDESLAEPPRFTLLPSASREAYLRAAAKAMDEIRSGRFYQINLLRYFRLKGAARGDLLARFAEVAGPYAAWIELPDLTLISFSPERFVQLRPQGEDLSALTCPIKGTAARHQETALDDAAAEALRNSPKDGAELAMIVDLMRNDLGRVSERGSVQVLEGKRLESFANVHHLVASVTSRLRPGLTLGEFLGSLMPAGSITGAPKREVMKAIREHEGRSRGYFMGSVFYLDDSGNFDSSVLIRTLVQRRDGPYEFAAGSGIVVGSDPDGEADEITAKCRIVGTVEED